MWLTVLLRFRVYFYTFHCVFIRWISLVHYISKTFAGLIKIAGLRPPPQNGLKIVGAKRAIFF